MGKLQIVFRISVTTILLNVFLNWLFVEPFGFAGLALTSSLVSFYYLGVTILFVYKDFDRGEFTKLFMLFVRVLIPTLIMAVPLWLLKEFTPVSELPAIVELLVLVPLGALAICRFGLFSLLSSGVLPTASGCEEEKVVGGDGSLYCFGHHGIVHDDFFFPSKNKSPTPQSKNGAHALYYYLHTTGTGVT